MPVADRASWLRRPVVVEEKLDGANVCIWWEGNGLQVAGRGGPGAMDRGGQLGPLRARVAERYEVLRPMLESGLVLYAEWLWLTHTVGYDRLPDHLVALDVLRPGVGFAPVPERDELCRRAGLVVAPRLFSGVLRTEDAVFGLLGPSTVGSMLMEGIVLRRD
ncbi:MAG: RNA ligase family protein, partial [Pseudonocardia sp.]|nr:RNA ligase family protein [Pseudonocardia sp.]